MKPFELTEDQKTMVSNYAAAHAAFQRYYGLMLAAEIRYMQELQPYEAPRQQETREKIKRYEHYLKVFAHAALVDGKLLGLTHEEIVCPRMAQYLPEPEMED